MQFGDSSWGINCNLNKTYFQALLLHSGASPVALLRIALTHKKKKKIIDITRGACLRISRVGCKVERLNPPLLSVAVNVTLVDGSAPPLYPVLVAVAEHRLGHLPCLPD